MSEGLTPIEEALVRLSASKGGTRWSGMNQVQRKAFYGELKPGEGMSDAPVLKAIQHFIDDPDGDFMPTIGQIKARLPGHKPDHDGIDLSRSFAWDGFGRFMGNPDCLSNAERAAIARSDPGNTALVKRLGFEPGQIPEEPKDGS